MSDPIPAWPRSLAEVVDDQLAAREKFRPLLRRLRPGQLLGLIDETGAELERRRLALNREVHPDPGTKIGNR
jgi:hypothetical protein